MDDQGKCQGKVSTDGPMVGKCGWCGSASRNVHFAWRDQMKAYAEEAKHAASNWRHGALTYDGLRTHPQFDFEALRRDIAVLADKLDALTATVGKILQMVAIKPPISAEQQAAAHKLYLHDEARAAMRAVDKVRR